MSETHSHYDAIVIGAGSGGYTAAIGLTGFGKRIAVIEGRYVGGDCTNVGCVPSKTLIHQAETRHAAESSSAAFRTVRHKRDHLREEETEQLQNIDNLDLLFGWARFADARHLDVAMHDGAMRRISADAIVIATGSRPREIAIPGLPPERMVTNETMFDLAEAPHHLAIVGSGPIGMEMACAFRKLGSDVSVITPNERVLHNVALEASQALQESLDRQGITVYRKAQAQRYDAANETLYVAVDGVSRAIAGVDLVLVAAGRELNVDALGLERVGVRYDARRGIPTNSYGRTNVAHIYAIGDVTPTSHFTHSANAQGRRVVQRLALPFVPAFGAEPLYPSATYSDPEVATIGLTPDDIARRFHPGLIRRVRVEMTAVDRGYTDSVPGGFVMIDAMKLTGRILGATIVGPHAADMLTLLTLAISQGISLYKLYQIVFPYPSYSEVIKRAADNYLRATLPSIKDEALAYARYRFASPPRDARPGAWAAEPS